MVLIGKIDDFALPTDGCTKKFTTNNPFKRGRILLVNHKNNFYATSNVCPHQGGPLSSGSIVDIEDTSLCSDDNSSHPVIECPIHSWQFDMQTGSCLSNKYVIDTYGVFVENGQIYLTPATNTNVAGQRRDFNGNEMVKSALGWI